MFMKLSFTISDLVVSDYPLNIIRIFHAALFIIEVYILSVAMPMFGLCSNLGNTL
jgi:hypothetical protein